MVGGGKDREKMRLIDAEKCPCIVCEDTRNAHCTYEHRSCEKFCNWLNNNAFDTEKVIEQLMIIHDEGYCPNEDGLECVLDKACSDCYREKIIDIVKKGGVE